MKRLFCSITCALLFLASVSAAQDAGGRPGIRQLLAEMDRLYRSGRSYAEIEMEVVTPDWKRTLSMDFWSEGLDRTFIVIKAPARDAGVATLRTGREMWNYFPKINKVMKVPPSMMLGSWMGSDFTNDDLVKESTLLDDYTGEYFIPEKPDAGLYYVSLKPKKETVSLWAEIKLTIGKRDLLPLREDYYDEKGRLMRTMEFSDVRRLGARTIPCTMKMVPLSNPGHSTVIRYRKAEFDGEPVPDTFTLRNLQRRR